MHVCVVHCLLHKFSVTYTGAIEVSIATMHKKDRSKCEEVYVCGFVPSYLLPNKRPNSLDPFIHPLVEEVKDIFINGNINLYALYIWSMYIYFKKIFLVYAHLYHTSTCEKF